jgi:poly(hydroxyalkanoate) depolymerase family esterase
MRLKIPTGLSRVLTDPFALQQQIWSALQPRSEGAESRRRPAPQRLTEVTGFGRNPGNLRMLEYVPPRPAGQAMPLVVVLHGCLQNAADFDRASGWTALARSHGFAVVFPEQKPANNSNLCFNWFRPSLVARDRGELGSIREMIASAAERHAIDAGRIFVMGLSAGGALASLLLATYPDLFNAGAVVAGLPVGSARDAMTAMSVMRNAAKHTGEEWAAYIRDISPEAKDFPRVSIWHGGSDAVVSVANAEASLLQWLTVHGFDWTDGEDDRHDGTARRRWRKGGSKGNGEAIVEMVTLDDFGHGLPVRRTRTNGEPSNETERFILPAPISAPEAMVRSWGLDKH